MAVKHKMAVKLAVQKAHSYVSRLTKQWRAHCALLEKSNSYNLP